MKLRLLSTGSRPVGEVIHRGEEAVRAVSRGRQALPMSTDVTGRLGELLAIQDGVVSRAQAVRLGVAGQMIDTQLRAGRWRQLQLGVYATFTGSPCRSAVLWAAVLRAGPGAVLSYHSAAELYRIAPRSELIHLTVPGTRQVRPVPGLVIHRSVGLERVRHPVLNPPRTRIEDTVLDLAAAAAGLDEAIHWLSAACGARLTTAPRLAAAAQARGRLRRRSAVLAVLGDTGAGAHSALEHRYVRDVERRHGLPRAARQARSTAAGRVQYRDNLYAEFGVCVELDGLAAHPVHVRWADQRRDNAAAALGLVTLRYNWADVHDRPCTTAAEVAAALRRRGWRGPVRPCRPGCATALVPPGRIP